MTASTYDLLPPPFALHRQIFYILLSQECMAYLVQLESVEWELQTRQTEIQTVTSTSLPYRQAKTLLDALLALADCLSKEQERLAGGANSEEARAKVAGLQEHLKSLNEQVQTWYTMTSS